MRGAGACDRPPPRLHDDLSRAGIDVLPARLLLSTREFKKTSMRYFEEER